MNRPAISWLWTVEGRMPLAAGQSPEQALDRLDPLLREDGTSHERMPDRLTFTKTNQPAQDPLATFDTGELRIAPGAAGPELRWRMVSRSLLFCLLAPLLFLSFAGLSLGAGALQGRSADTAKRDDKKKDIVRPQNPVDVWLGAPAPEKPDPAKKDKKDEGPSPTSAYVFAAIFATLFVAGRFLEARNAQRLFRRQLSATG